MNLIKIEKRILHILEIYDKSDNKEELDKELTKLRGQLASGEMSEDESTYQKYLKIALEKGISKQAFDKRLENPDKWTYEKASTLPTRRKSKHPIVNTDEYKKWRAVAAERNINLKKYYRRVVRHGMSPEEAAIDQDGRRRRTSHDGS